MSPEDAVYVDSLGPLPEPMTREQEHAAFERVRAGDAEARHEVVRANLRLVLSIAQRLASRGLPLEDLVQTGTVALYETVDRHARSTHKTRKFSTYASVRILSHLSDLIRRSGSLGITQKVWSLEGPVPSHMRRVLSLDAQTEEGDEEKSETLGEVVVDEDQAPPWAEMDAAVVRRRLGRALAGLPPKWREVVDLRFGLAGVGPLRLEEIAMREGYSFQRAHALLGKALKQLRLDLETEE